MLRRPALWGIPCLLALAASSPTIARTDDTVADAKARLARAGGPDQYKANALVVLDETDIEVKDSGIGVATRRKIVKILRESAIRVHAVQRFEYDPLTNNLELIAIRVYRADGRVENVPLDARVDEPRPAHMIYWGGKQFVVTLPRLAVGDAYETISRLTGFNVAYLAGDETPCNALGQPLRPPLPGHWHDEVHFWSSLPVIEKRYSVRISARKPLQFKVYNGELETSVKLDGDHLVYTFVKKDIAPHPSEPAMEPAPNVFCKLLLATVPDWPTKGRWLHSVSEPQLKADDAIRKKVAEIIKGCKTDEEKYTALNHWVAENVRYAGTTRGMSEGYTIHDIKETFRDRCGVCKDKAGMLCGMLRVAGFEAYTVMTMARQRVDDIPADQFNHCVTCIRTKDGKLILLDPTWMPKSRDNWSTLEPLQHVVFGTPEGEPLRQSPYFPPKDNLAQWTVTTTISPDNDLSGSLRFTSCGAPEGRLRRTLAGLPPAERTTYFDRSVQRVAANAQAGRVRFTDPDDFSRPMNIELDWTAGGYALGDGAVRAFRLPGLQTILGDRTLYDLAGKTRLARRKFGIRLLATRLAKIEETLRLPAGWKPEHLPEPVELDGPSASLRFAIDAKPGRIHYTCELAIKHWLIPADEYANFKNVMDTYDKLTHTMVVCKLEAGSVRR